MTVVQGQAGLYEVDEVLANSDLFAHLFPSFLSLSLLVLPVPLPR